ncbi:MAG: VanZ family protein [Acetivibrionales bacterium]|nr:VanZ family protein [Bacillota bacterium]
MRNRGAEISKSFLLVMLISVLYADSCEIHQLFVLGRGCQVTDVVIDSAGVLAGLGITSIAGPFERRGGKGKDNKVGDKCNKS